MEAIKYINKIRNKGKRAFALAWLDYLMGVTDDGPTCNQFKISYMAAQAVRMQLSELTGFER